MLEFIGPAIWHLFEPLNIFLMLAGLTGGIIIGALPGLSATMGVALMVPVTFAMNEISGLIMLGAIYAGAIYGGANSAILIRTPGTPSSVATTFDGWPMCLKGQADEALYGSLISSASGGIFGNFMLLFLAAPLAVLSLKFGAPESFWLCVFGLSTIAVMSSGNMVKGLLSGAVGLLCSTVGMDPHEAVPRFTFGYYPLVQGLAIIPAMIGLFSFSQVMYLVGSYKPFIARYCPTKGAFWQTFKILYGKCKIVLLRSSIIGSFVGMLPGAGGEIAAIIAYNESKRWDKNPEKYGTGVIEGVASSESSNNAVIGGSLIPMLTLGIPGSAVAAVIMGALLAKGIQPGFKVFTVSGELTYTFIMSQFAVNLLMLPVGYMLVKIMTKLLKVRLTMVAIGIVMLSFIGSYAIGNSLLDMWVVLVFGIFGYLCHRFGLDTGAMALGLILGAMIEENLGKTEQLSHAMDGGTILTVFSQSTVSVALIALTLLSMITPFLLKLRRTQKAKVEGIELELPHSNMSPQADLGSGLMLLGVAALFGSQLYELGGLGLMFPKALVYMIGVGGLYLIAKGLWKYKTKYRHEPFETASTKRIAIIVAGSIIYAALTPLLGFYLVSGLFLFGMTVCLPDEGVGMKRTVINGVILSLVMCVSIYVFFTILLNVPTPEVVSMLNN